MLAASLRIVIQSGPNGTDLIVPSQELHPFGTQLCRLQKDDEMAGKREKGGEIRAEAGTSCML